LLALLAAGAGGEARAELTEALGLPAEGAEEHALAVLNAVAASMDTDAALALWARAEVPFTPWWTQTIPAEARKLLTGEPDVDRANLDAWVVERTHGLLQKMPVELTPETLVVLASAISVRTTWAEPLMDQAQKIQAGPWAGEEPVEGLTGESADVDRISVAQTPVGPLTLLAMIGNGDVDVHLALGVPDRGPGEVLPAALAALAGDHPRQLGSDLPLGTPGPGLRVDDEPAYAPAPVLAISTMRFSVSASHDLLQHSGLFGLETATGPGAHFPLISPQPLQLGEARQDVTATFSAEGFEAAAVTGMAMLAGFRIPEQVARKIKVRFDRPFGFVVVHRPTGLVLLVGWVAAPQLSSAD
jgi:serine protease inhibitor